MAGVTLTAKARDLGECGPMPSMSSSSANGGSTASQSLPCSSQYGNTSTPCTLSEVLDLSGNKINNSGALRLFKLRPPNLRELYLHNNDIKRDVLLQAYPLVRDMPRLTHLSVFRFGYGRVRRLACSVPPLGWIEPSYRGYGPQWYHEQLR